MNETLAAIGIWAGVVVGVLTVADWLLLEAQKKWLRERFEDAWLWLAYQRLGRFTELLRNRRVQTGFAACCHVMMLVILLGFLARVYLGVRINAEFQLGQPRVYPFQIWVDVAALLISTAMVSWRLHPRVAAWIGNARSIPEFLVRAWALLLIVWPILCFGLLIPEFFLIGPMQGESHAAIVAGLEHRLGGRVGVTLVHAITALISAPIMAEGLLVMTIAFLSLYWIIIVWSLAGIAKAVQFILLRIVESPKGPVLGISGFLIGVGAIIKAVI
jgi:hypothetical protein